MIGGLITSTVLTLEIVSARTKRKGGPRARALEREAPASPLDASHEGRRGPTFQGPGERPTPHAHYPRRVDFHVRPEIRGSSRTSPSRVRSHGCV
jgi:hypothetical protein